MSILELPTEIIEKIFYYCDYISFISLCMTCKTMKQIYDTYQLEKIPTYLGIVKITIEYENIEQPFNDDSDNDIEIYESINARNKMKMIVSNDIEIIADFFQRFTLNTISFQLNHHTRVKQINYHYKQINYNDRITLHFLEQFHTCRLHTMFAVTAISTFRSFIKNLEKQKSHQINMIKTFLGPNKLEQPIILHKIIVKEYDSFINPLNITTIIICKKKNDRKTLSDDLIQIEKQFITSYPYIEYYTSHISTVPAKMNCIL